MSCDCLLSALRRDRANPLQGGRFGVENYETAGRYGYIVWQCDQCGKQYTCECFRGSMEALARQGYPGWSQLTARQDVKGVEYRKGICHLCRDVIPSGVEYWYPGGPGTPKVLKKNVRYTVGHLYHSYIVAQRLQSNQKVDTSMFVGITDHYEPTISGDEAENRIRDRIGIPRIGEISEREAENLLRDRLGLPRIGEGWVSETQLYNQLCALFPDLRLEREASPEWLGRLRFDIFLPDVGVAVEYQGEQHYRPVELFGGAEGFERTRRRDLLKRRRARKAGVQVVEFRHDEELTDEDVRERIGRAIEARRTERESQEDRP